MKCLRCKYVVDDILNVVNLPTRKAGVTRYSGRVRCVKCDKVRHVSVSNKTLLKRSLYRKLRDAHNLYKGLCDGTTVGECCQ